MVAAIANLTPVSPLHNLTNGALVDELGTVKAQAADLKAREDALKAELIARRVTEAEGALFRATITDATRWTLDTDKVKSETGTDWYVARCRVSATTTVRLCARTGSATRRAA
jgi:hypothetical protein